MDRSAADPAPALGRGLALLRHLASAGPSTLDQLAAATDWPKSSVHRCLASLQLAGAVDRDPATRRYRPLLRLAPLQPEQDRLRQRWAHHAVALAADTGQTIELHHFGPRRLTMIDRREPDAVVSVRARVGFQRQFNEMDSLTQIVFAFGLTRSNWPRKRAWAWSAGKQKPLGRAAIDKLIQAARRHRFATDLDININGVRRYAAPLLDQHAHLAAVLAIAQVCGPRDAKPATRFQKLIKTTADQLSQAVPDPTN